MLMIIIMPKVCPYSSCDMNNEFLWVFGITIASRCDLTWQIISIHTDSVSGAKVRKPEERNGRR